MKNLINFTRIDEIISNDILTHHINTVYKNIYVIVTASDAIIIEERDKSYKFDPTIKDAAHVYTINTLGAYDPLWLMFLEDHRDSFKKYDDLTLIELSKRISGAPNEVYIKVSDAYSNWAKRHFTTMVDYERSKAHSKINRFLEKYT